MEAKHWVVLAAVVGLGAEMSACSSDFSTCEASRTCVSGGAGGNGDAGEASDLGGAGGGGKGQTEAGAPATDAGASNAEPGAGGEAQVIACDRDSDCKDDLACNGVETCVDGACKAGVSPCANPEPAHCDAVCTEKDGAASCSVRGQDKDKDEHFSSACVAHPGDDCDDSAATVYAGAPELCDGIDNDCNLKLDASDGLAVGGKTTSFGPASTVRSLPTIAWAEGKSVYGIAYRDTTTSTTSDLYFEEVDQAGAVKRAPKAINDTTSKTSPSGALGLAWGGDTFAVAFRAGNSVYTRMIGSDGTLTSVRAMPLSATDASFYSPLPVSPALARNTNGDWAIAAIYSDGDGGPPTLFTSTLTQAGAFGDAVIHTSADEFEQPGDGPSIAAVSSNFVMGSSIGELVDPTFKLLKKLTDYGSFPRVASSAHGIGLAYRASDSVAPNAQLFSPSGVSQCGPLPFADKSFKPASMVATSKGYLIVSLGPVRVQEVFFDCSLGSSFTVDEVTDVSDVHIAGSAAGYGVVWQDNVAHLPKARFFGPKYCD